MDVFRRIRLRETVSVQLQTLISSIRACQQSTVLSVLVIFCGLRDFYASFPVYKLSDGLLLCSHPFE